MRICRYVHDQISYKFVIAVVISVTMHMTTQGLKSVAVCFSGTPTKARKSLHSRNPWYGYETEADTFTISRSGTGSVRSDPKVL